MSSDHTGTTGPGGGDALHTNFAARANVHRLSDVGAQMMWGGTDPDSWQPDTEVGVYALRTFHVDGDTGKLLPVSWHSHPRGEHAWQGGTCVATCMRWSRHVAPVEDCGCGIYGFRDLQTLRAQYSPSNSLVAVIALEGHVIEGSYGYRAQAARVVGLWADPRTVPKTLRDKIAGQTADARWYDDLDALVAGHHGLRHTTGTPEHSDSKHGASAGPFGPRPWAGSPWRTRLRHAPLHTLRPLLQTVRFLVVLAATAAVYGGYHLAGLDHPGARRHGPGWSAFVGFMRAVQTLAVQVGSPGYAARILLLPVLAAVVAVLFVGFGLRTQFHAVPHATYRILRVGNRIGYLVVVCTLTAAFLGKPTAFGSPGFWVALGVAGWALSGAGRITYREAWNLRASSDSDGLIVHNRKNKL